MLHLIIRTLLPAATVLVLGAGDTTAQLCVEAPPGLVSWWQANGNSTDSLSGNHAMLVNGASCSAGKVDRAFTLDGIDDYVVTHSPPTNLSLSGAFTVACWFRTSSAARQNLFTYYSPTTERGINVQIPAPSHAVANQLLCDVYAPYPSNWVRLTSGSAINDGAWHFVVLLRDAANTMQLFIDGSLRMSSSLTGDATPAVGSPLFIGAAPWGSDPWAGQIDEIDFYDRALTVSEIVAIYAADTAGKCLHPETGIIALIDSVRGLIRTGALSAGPGGGLIAKLNAALSAFNRHSIAAMIGSMGAFINQVTALIITRHLEWQAGQMLIQQGTAVTGNRG